MTSLEYPAEMSKQEAEAYVKHLEGKHHRKLDTLKIEIGEDAAGEYVDLHYVFETVPFERIRRITGYLVGDMSMWNDAKTAEEADRVKHLDSQGKFEDLS